MGRAWESLGVPGGRPRGEEGLAWGLQQTLSAQGPLCPPPFPLHFLYPHLRQLACSLQSARLPSLVRS